MPSFLFLFVSKCFVNESVKRLLRSYITKNQYVIFIPQQFNTFRLACKSAGIRHGNLHEWYLLFWWIDENIYKHKEYSGLHPHQTLNKRICLMKRGNGRSLTHLFSFDERFDERMLSAISMVLSILSYPFINSSDFHPSSSLLWKQRRWVSLSAGWSNGLPVCWPIRKNRHRWQKKKVTNVRRHHRRRLLGTKSHSSLGRFLYAPLTLMLKTPQWANGVAPLWTSRLFRKEQ